jgi:hypothetical protein
MVGIAMIDDNMLKYIYIYIYIRTWLEIVHLCHSTTRGLMNGSFNDDISLQSNVL